MLLGHRWLYDFAEILHRDISSGNIMYRIIDGKVYGVLNDLDLSSLREDVTKGTPTSFQRTGTPPYMAIDLLVDDGSAPRHLYRHDLESLAYAILLRCSRHKFIFSDHLERLLKPPFDGWFDANVTWSDLAGRKVLFFRQLTSVANIIHPSFQDFVPWLNTLLSAFKEGFKAKETWDLKVTAYNDGHLQPSKSKRTLKRSVKKAFGAEEEDADTEVSKPEPFDEETLGGAVVFRSLARSLISFGGEELEYHGKDWQSPETAT